MGIKKLTIEQMQALAKERGGVCLSTTYVGANSNLWWRCKDGHEWEAIPNAVKNKGTWCPVCRGGSGQLQTLQELAQDQGGRCLAESYLGATKPLPFECARGHRFEKKPVMIREGRWCRICANENMRGSLEEMQRIASTRDGRCLSEKYNKSMERLEWECAVGHTWWAVPANISRGSWCPVCSGNVGLSIRQMQDLAHSQGGRCLSTTYVNNHSHLLWECELGHQWEATANLVKDGETWCPECSVGVSERLCRAAMQQMFGAAFPKKKPPWLLSERGTRLELDGYCEKLALAFEFQGQQHFQTIAYMTPDAGALRRRQADDAHKRRLCVTQGVRLIEVIQVKGRIPTRQDLMAACKQAGFSVALSAEQFAEAMWKARSPRLQEEAQALAAAKGGHCRASAVLAATHRIPWECANGHWWSAPLTRVRSGTWCLTCASGAPIDLAELQQYATAKGGECLATEFVNSSTKTQWRCADGHEWEAQPSIVRRGWWCRKCASRAGNAKRKGTIEDMARLAREWKGKCLSDEYVDVNTKLDWECSAGHVWSNTPGKIKSGRWCPVCAKAKKCLTVGEMKTLAKERGGACLSTVYVDTQTKLRWRCAEGHEWEAKPGNVKRGGWCPVCAKAKSRLTVGEMKTLAKERGGACLSTVYVDVETKLRWRCAERHEWEATPLSIKYAKSWCPTCARRSRITLEQMQAVAKERGGECLSTVYVTSATKLRWRCAEGHEWEATPSSVNNQETWCPACAGKLRVTIEQIQAVAKEQKGVCLSTVYVNNRTKLRWRCAEGHEWEATLSTVKLRLKKGYWCPTCARPGHRTPA